MGIKKDAFFRDMVRVVVAFEDRIRLWTELFNRFQDRSEEAFDYVVQNRNRYEKLLYDIVPQIDAMEGKGLRDVVNSFKQTFAIENDRIKKSQRKSFEENELGDILIRDFQKNFRDVRLDNVAMNFLRSIVTELSTAPENELIEKMHLFFSGKRDFLQRYREIHERFRRGELSVSPESPTTQQQKRDIAHPELIKTAKTAGVSHRRVILQYLNSLDQR